MEVSFNAENHTYTNNLGENYISVTTLLGKYKPPFDKDKAAARVAAREGLTVEEILSYWADLNRIATERGTLMHKAVEDFILTREIENSDLEYLCRHIETQLIANSQFEVKGEELLYNHEYQIAGTADIILENDKYFKIWDLKTNKKINFTNNFNDGKFLFKPVDHLVNCEYTNYALQLSAYAFLKEQITGKKCVELKIIHSSSSLNLNKEINESPVPYLKTDIKNIFLFEKDKKGTII